MSSFSTFGKICARFISPFEGERLAAFARAQEWLLKYGTEFIEALEKVEKLELAEEVAKAAIAEANYWRERAHELEHQQPDWQSLATPVGDHRQVVEWLFAQHRAGRVWLSPWELQAFANFARWVGNLRPAQRARLQNTVERVYDQTGLRPPP